MLYWFQMLSQWLESEADAELYTLLELHVKMVKFSGGSDVFTLKKLVLRWTMYLGASSTHFAITTILLCTLAFWMDIQQHCQTKN